MRKRNPQAFDDWYGVAGVYVLYNEVNGKIYIGSSQNIYDRLREHYNDLATNKHGNYHLQNAYNKYGHDNITWFVHFFYDSIDDARLRLNEDSLIDIYLAYDRDYGYNLRKENKGSRRMSEETKAKFCKPVIEYKIETGEVVEHPSAKSVSKTSGIVGGAIKRRGITNRSYWFFKDDFSLDELKIRFTKKRTHKVKFKLVVLDQKTGTTYYGFAAIRDHLKVRGGNVYKRLSEESNRYKIL